MSKNIKGILFDFNGTLFFDSQLHINAFKKYFTEHGKDEPTAEFIVREVFGKSNQRIYSDFFVPNPTDEQWQKFGDDKEGLYRGFCLEDPSLMQYTRGVPAMLDYLKANHIPYCLATGCGMDNLSFYMEHMDMGRWFTLDNIVYFDGSFAGKPAPDTYILAAQKLGLDTSECLVFEDGTSGIISAQSAGAAAVVCVCEETLPSPLVGDIKVDGVHHSFEDWQSILADFGILR